MDYFDSSRLIVGDFRSPIITSSIKFLLKLCCVLKKWKNIEEVRKSELDLYYLQI